MSWTVAGLKGAGLCLSWCRSLHVTTCWEAMKSSRFPFGLRGSYDALVFHSEEWMPQSFLSGLTDFVCITLSWWVWEESWQILLFCILLILSPFWGCSHGIVGGVRLLELFLCFAGEWGLCLHLVTKCSSSYVSIPYRFWGIGGFGVKNCKGRASAHLAYVAWKTLSILSCFVCCCFLI